MENLIKESVSIDYSNNTIDLNLTRFGDCVAMSVEKINSYEKRLFEDHINYVLDKCEQFIFNNGQINIYKNIWYKNLRHKIDIKTLKTTEDVKDFKNHIEFYREFRDNKNKKSNKKKRH